MNEVIINKSYRLNNEKVVIRLLKTALKILTNFTLCRLIAALTTNTQMFIIGRVRYHFKTATDGRIKIIMTGWMNGSYGYLFILFSPYFTSF